jgi:DNA-binding response OmpR family regulator
MAKRILIIDDERDMRVYLSRLLQKAGYETQEARDGEEGLALARNGRPDLITLDLILPRKSGFQVFQELRSGEDTRDIPVIIVTGLSRQKASTLGPDVPVLEKPIEQAVFLGLVREEVGA